MLTRRSFALMAAATVSVTGTPTWSQTALDAEGLFRLEARYLAYYLDLKAKTAAGDPVAKGMLSQFAAFLGDEETAIGLDERPRNPSQDIPALNEAVAQDAIEAIVERARDARIVILNEAHNVSGHRAFAAKVMRALRPLGFDWFAAETFTPLQEGPAPSIRTYQEGTPFFSSLGYYSLDPVFAELVHEAARMGYRFTDYEIRPNQRAPDNADRLEQIAVREEAQADNLIEAVLAQHPGAKIFVLCGYSHAMEQAGRGGEWFAARLKSKTGLDPLTIEQSANWPAIQPDNDPAHVAAVLRRFDPKAPIAVFHEGGMFAERDYVGKMDLSVFHPRLAAVVGRPGWLAADPDRRRIDVDVPEVEDIALLQALWSREGVAGVPADQFIVSSGQRRATLFLHPGHYSLRLERPSGFDSMYGEIEVKA